MTTVDAPNVHNVAVEGTFDDCQDLVKALLRRRGVPRRASRLSAMNSINWARVMAQVVYYVDRRRPARAAARSRCRPGNFGNIFAGLDRRADGRCRSTSSSSGRTATTSSPAGPPTARWSPSRRRAHATARRWTSRCRPTTSGCSSSCSGRDGAAHRRPARPVPGRRRRRGAARPTAFDAASLDDASHARRDPRGPRTAPGCSSTRTPRSASAPPGPRRRPATRRWSALATAHPAKFPDAVEQATGIRPPLPERLADLFDREERFDVLPNDVEAVRAHVLAAVAA